MVISSISKPHKVEIDNTNMRIYYYKWYDNYEDIVVEDDENAISFSFDTNKSMWRLECMRLKTTPIFTNDNFILKVKRFARTYQPLEFNETYPYLVSLIEYAARRGNTFIVTKLTEEERNALVGQGFTVIRKKDNFYEVGWKDI